MNIKTIARGTISIWAFTWLLLPTLLSAQGGSGTYHIFYTDGQLEEIYSNSTGWHHENVSQLMNPPGPSAFYCPQVSGHPNSSGGQTIFFEASNNVGGTDAWVAYWNKTTGQWSAYNMTSAAGHGGQASNAGIVGFQDSQGQDDVFFVGEWVVNGNWTGGQMLWARGSLGSWTISDLSQSATNVDKGFGYATTPASGAILSGLVSSASNGYNVFYVSSDNKIDRFHASSIPGSWTMSAETGPDASVPNALAGTTDSTGDYMFFSNVGQTWHMAYAPGASSATLGSLNNSVAYGPGGVATGNGRTFAAFKNSTGLHMYYPGADGHIWSWYQPQGSSSWITGNIGSGFPAWDGGGPTLAGFTAGSNNAMLLFYVDSGLHVQEAYSTPGVPWKDYDLTNLSGGFLGTQTGGLQAFVQP